MPRLAQFQQQLSGNETRRPAGPLHLDDACCKRTELVRQQRQFVAVRDQAMIDGNARDGHGVNRALKHRISRRHSPKSALRPNQRPPVTIDFTQR
jgi:hypothetical protein